MTKRTKKKVSITWTIALLTVGLAARYGVGEAVAPFALDLPRLDFEPWRFVTGHLTHWSWSHLAWDLAVFVGLGWVVERQDRRAVGWTLALAVALIGLGAPVLTGELVVYRGLSGLDAALFGWLAATVLRSGLRPAARCAGALALVGLAAKVVWETAVGLPLFMGAAGAAGAAGEVFVVPAAHLLGGLAGVAVALCRATYPASSGAAYSQASALDEAGSSLARSRSSSRITSLSSASVSSDVAWSSAASSPPRPPQPPYMR